MNQVLVSEFAVKDMRGLAMGYSVMITLLGNIVGPSLFGSIADTMGSYSLAWWFLTASALMSVFLLALVQEGKRRNMD